MNISRLSDSYSVRVLTPSDIEIIYNLSVENPLFYQYCPPFVTKESILSDMQALPPGTTYEDKHYIGFFENDRLIAVMDLIFNYPDSETAFVGFFMMRRECQGQGIGSEIIKEAFAYIRTQKYHRIKLGFARGNPQSEAFWTKNGFQKTGVTYEADGYTVVVMEREI